MQTKSVVVTIALLLAALPLAANAANWIPLSDTGQTTCYDVAGGFIPCQAEGLPLHGQDANYRGQQQAFQDNANGTVTDLNTELMWQQSDDGTKRTWQEAIDYCSGLTHGGYSNWRLPESLELYSIVDYERITPAINPVFSCQSSHYWSTTTFVINNDLVWLVNFHNGRGHAGGKTSYSYVRCVSATL